jgi:hypothetical protein
MLGTVHIIESVTNEDLHEKRTEGGMLAQSLLLAGMTSTYRRASDRNAFIEYIREVSRSAQTARELIPAVHFSCHGNQTGIALTSGEEICWPELRNMLLPVNRAASGNLIVGMSTCYGLFGTGMALHPHDAPFRSLIGPVDTVTFADSAIAFTVFYHQLSKGTLIERAVEVMKVASGEEHFGLVDGQAARTAVRNAIIEAGLTVPEA